MSQIYPCAFDFSVQLVDLFGSVRDEWIEKDLPSWLGANRIYEGVADPVRHALEQDEAYIVTTKQVRQSVG